MKLIKSLLGIMFIISFSLFTFVLADDCFDTVIDREGNVYYIDPFDEGRVAMNKKTLLSEYGDKIKCTGGKKVYSQDEYLKTQGILYNDIKTGNQSEKSSGEAIIELILLILSCVAMWKIFVKAGKPGIYSIIPIYNFYELSDIAGLQGMFRKAFLCGFAGLFLSLFIPLLGVILVSLVLLYGALVNFNVAKNFGWSNAASILYVIFNPVAMLILAFGNDKYFLEEEKLKRIAMKAKMDEIDKLTVGMDEEFDSIGEENTQKPEVSIKYPDTSNF